MLWRLFLVSLLIFAADLCAAEDGLTPEGLNETLEFVKGILPKHLDMAPNLQLQIPLPGLVDGNFTIETLALEGLADFVFSSIVVTPNFDFLNFTLLFRTISFRLGYDIDTVLVTFFPLFGAGTFRVVIEDLEIKLANKINHTEMIHVHDLSLNITLGNLKLEIDGLLYDDGFSNIFNGIFDIIANLIRVTINQPMGKDLTKHFQDLINDAIRVIVHFLDP